MSPTARRLALAAAAVLAAAVALAGVAPPAGAAPADNHRRRDNIVVITGRAEVAAGETFHNVFIVDGPLTVDGTVTDSAVAIHGDVLIHGTVKGNVAALDGTVTVDTGGHVEGDITSRHRPIVAEGGRFDGSWQRWNPSLFTRAGALVARAVWWLAMTVSILVLGVLLWLIAPRGAFAVHEAARDRTGPVIGWGVLFAIGLPLVALIAVGTLLVLPLGLAVLAALFLLYVTGYTAACWILGRGVASGAHPLVSFLAGWGILRVVALIPFLGGLSWIVAVVFGLGAIAVAIFRARHPAEPAGAAATDAPGVPPAPPPQPGEPAPIS